jgi:hypothetical protein
VVVGVSCSVVGPKRYERWLGSGSSPKTSTIELDYCKNPSTD